MYFNLIIEGILEYSDDFLRNAIDILDNEVDKRKKQPGFRTFPDQLIKTLDICLLIETLSNPQQSWGESCTQVAITKATEKNSVVYYVRV